MALGGRGGSCLIRQTAGWLFYLDQLGWDRLGWDLTRPSGSTRMGSDPPIGVDVEDGTLRDDHRNAAGTGDG